ncbi:LysR family transcriptional regulator [Paraburkholderia sp. EG287B]|uniref:LysR family transcriptional regulator n=1 Tax=Paraburkholderia sp. EG287B TaxID=3237010 RepID=UPI0034D25D09
MDTLLSMRVFCMVAEHKSFTVAASRLGLSPAMASKHVLHLESRVGARLLNRTSRHVSLTDTGHLYFGQIRPMLEGLDEVEAAVSNVTVTPRGMLKLSAPVWAANTLMARAFAEYHHLYPDVSFDVDLSGRIVNLVDEGFDLALRAMTSARLDPGLIARPLMDVPFYLVASPAYLERAGRPSTLGDLNGHSLLMYSGINFSGSLAVKGRDGEEAVRFRAVMRSENETMLHLAALEGMGLVFLPAWITQSDISKGELEHVMHDEIKFAITLHAVYPSRKYLSAKVRTFIDFLASRPDICHQG